MTSAIEIHDLAKRFPNGVQALAGVSLAVPAGRFVSLLGPSGAGKSTMLRCINGLVTGFEGSIRVEGIPVVQGPGLRQVQQRIGMVFQQFNLVRRITVIENVLCGRLSYLNPLFSGLRFFSDADVAMAMAALERVGLPDKAHVRADQLSGGQQQRVGIARALVQRPSIILADEPVASLDPVSARRILELLREIHERDGVTVVASLHDPRLACEFGERVIGLSHGRLVLDLPADRITPREIGEVYERPISDDLTVVSDDPHDAEVAVAVA